MNNVVKRGYGSITIRLLALGCLLFSVSALATAPRIVPKLFGEERRSDVVGYQAAPQDAAASAESALKAKLVSEAYAAAGKPLVVDLLPSRQLAKYALLNSDAQAMIGGTRDIGVTEQSQYRQAVFYISLAGGDDGASMLIIISKNARAAELLQAFHQGLKQLMRSGKYKELLEQHYGKGKVPADYFNRLQRLNPALK